MAKHYDIEGHAHFLTFSCYKRLWLFKDYRMYSEFIDTLNKARLRWKFKLHGFVVMPNHVHLVIFPDVNTKISNILSSIKKPYAYWALRYLETHWNKIYLKLNSYEGFRKNRRFWQMGGGFDKNIIYPKVLIKTIEYIHGNPVRNGIAEKTTDWKWSSARFYEFDIEDPIKIDSFEF